MSTKSEIGWTDYTWSPVVGCSKVSEGCTNCYAIKTARRLGEAFHQKPYEGLTRKFPDGSINWTGEVRTLPERLEDPLHWKKPRRVFVNSMSDLFHEEVPVRFIAEVWSIMAVCSNLTFQILTKRPERMAPLIGDPTFMGQVLEAMEQRASERGWCLDEFDEWPLPNVWLGTSVENQAAADERIPLLLDTPAAVRFLSCEPLLGALDLSQWIPPTTYTVHPQGPKSPETWAALDALAHAVARQYCPPPIQWIITGGESSGPAERRLVERCCRSGSPFSPERGDCAVYDRGECDLQNWCLKPEALGWLRSIRDQCTAAGVAHFHKQNGGPTHNASGRLLDGRTHDEFPETA